MYGGTGSIPVIIRQMAGLKNGARRERVANCHDGFDSHICHINLSIGAMV